MNNCNYKRLTINAFFFELSYNWVLDIIFFERSDAFFVSDLSNDLCTLIFFNLEMYPTI